MLLYIHFEEMSFQIGVACTRSQVAVTLESSGQNKSHDRKGYQIHNSVTIVSREHLINRTKS
jgi:hypothetical protein